MFENFVGIDISKNYFDASVEVSGKVRHHQFPNTDKGFEALLNWCQKWQVGSAHFCMEAAGVLPADFQITGAPEPNAQSQKYTVYEQPASQALAPLPPIGETVTSGPYDSATKLNIQITNVPEVSPPMTGQQVLNYFETATQVGAASVRPVEVHLAQPNAINKDLLNAAQAVYGFAENAATNPNQLIQDGKNAFQWSTQQLENVGEKMDKPMTPEQRAQMAGAILPLFFVDGEAMSPKASKQMGLENMTPEQLEGLGIKKVELPIKLANEKNFIGANIPGYGANFCGDVVSPGVVRTTVLFRGTLPEGAGSNFLAEALKAHDALPTKELVLKGIVNPATLKAFREGVAAEDTLLGKCATKALDSLGITPTSYRYEVVNGTLNIIIKTGS
jgi:hypothetical protein